MPSVRIIVLNIYFRTLSEMTEGFSAKEIAEIVTKALMEPVRKVETATHFKWVCKHPCPFSTGTGTYAQVPKWQFHV